MTVKPFTKYLAIIYINFFLVKSNTREITNKYGEQSVARVHKHYIVCLMKMQTKKHTRQHRWCHDDGQAMGEELWYVQMNKW